MDDWGALKDKERATKRLRGHLPKLAAISCKTINENLITAKNNEIRIRKAGHIPFLFTELDVAKALVRLKKRISKNPEDAEKIFERSIDHTKKPGYTAWLFGSMSWRIISLARVRQ